MKQNEWKIIYTSYEGINKRTINLLSREAGKNLIRENGVYRIYVLPCEKEGATISKNAFFVSCYKDSKIIQKYVKSDDIPENGFLVKVIPNPDNKDGRFVILTAHTEQQLFYSVVSFLDDYIPENAPFSGSNRMPDMIFDSELPEYCYTSSPDFKTRSIFTWGHSINDYRGYIDNMARMRFNELVVWNDFIPLNISDIIDYAHSYGIRVILGYSWGWKEIGNKTDTITEESIKKVKELAIREYKENYCPINCDGIYFQSFTERKEDRVGGKLIAQLVTDMVNEVADELWKINPELRLLFGLHATSVKSHMDIIAKVNPKIELYWEDCGEYPYGYLTYVTDWQEYEETLRFTKEILELRGGKGITLVFKGVMMLCWPQFVNQAGPYVMGENSEVISSHDRTLRKNAWREYSADWMKNGEYAARMIEFIKENRVDEVGMCLAGTFDGSAYFPVAVCAEMFFGTDDKYNDIMRKIARRSYITID